MHPQSCSAPRLLGLAILGAALAAPATASPKPETPFIDYVVPLVPQPHAKDKKTIWYDDFDGKAKSYAEGKSPLDDTMAMGGKGRSLLCLYEKGQQGRGGRKVFFGDAPTYQNNTVRRGEIFNEVYWRIYVKHQYGWTGAPAKMSRATSLTSANWAQAMIAHVWSSGAALTLDPARGVRGDKVVTRKYNDFEKMKWLGNKPVSKFLIHATEQSGRWVSVEARARLNTPGKRDGINQLWIDGRLECERTGLDFRGSYTGHGINAVFLEAYWNKGSPVTQRRWYDNFVIATVPIGPVVCPTKPTVVRTPPRGIGKPGTWEVQVASGIDGKGVVYRSNALPMSKFPDRVVINKTHGRFVGALAGKKSLASGRTYSLRIRQRNAGGIRSNWSGWHQRFSVK